MKKVFLMMLFLLFSLYGKTQKLAEIDYDYKDKKVIFPVLIKELTKEDRYSIIIPSKLSYYSGQDVIAKEIWDPFANFIEIKAKIHMAKPAYRFEIIAPGLRNVAPKDTRWYKTELPDQGGIYREVKGFVGDYSCNFPCKLVIKDGEGKVMDTIIISGDFEEHVVTVHRDFIQGIANVYPFSNQEEINTLEKQQAPLIRKRMEKIVATKIFSRVSQSITFLYKNYNTYKQTYGYGFIKVKKGEQSLLPELDKVVNDYKNALDSLGEGNFAFCSQVCEANTSVMEKLLSSNDSRMDKNVQEILYYNLSHSNLFTGNFEDAWKYYHLFIQSGVSEQARIAYELKGRITLYQDYVRIKLQINN